MPHGKLEIKFSAAAVRAAERSEKEFSAPFVGGEGEGGGALWKEPLRELRNNGDQLAPTRSSTLSLLALTQSRGTRASDLGGISEKEV